MAENIVTLDKWCCSVCEYLYDPYSGDLLHGVKPRTPFKLLPGDWVCPDCGAGRYDFIPYVGEMDTDY